MFQIIITTNLIYRPSLMMKIESTDHFHSSESINKVRDAGGKNSIIPLLSPLHLVGGELPEMEFPWLVPKPPSRSHSLPKSQLLLLFISSLVPWAGAERWRYWDQERPGNGNNGNSSSANCKL